MHGSEDEQASYQEGVMEKVMAQIQEDRANRKAAHKETPPVLIGGAGMNTGLVNSL